MFYQSCNLKYEISSNAQDLEKEKLATEQAKKEARDTKEEFTSLQKEYASLQQQIQQLNTKFGIGTGSRDKTVSDLAEGEQDKYQEEFQGLDAQMKKVIEGFAHLHELYKQQKHP